MRAKKGAAAAALPIKIFDIGRLKPARVLGQAPAIATVLTMDEMYGGLSRCEQRLVDDLVRLLWRRHQ
jgi:hypothetical protein